MRSQALGSRGVVDALEGVLLLILSSSADPAGDTEAGVGLSFVSLCPSLSVNVVSGHSGHRAVCGGG